MVVATTLKAYRILLPKANKAKGRQDLDETLPLASHHLASCALQNGLETYFGTVRAACDTALNFKHRLQTSSLELNSKPDRSKTEDLSSHKGQ